MHLASDDVERLRIESDALARDPRRDRRGAVAGAPCMVVQTSTKTAYPSAAQSFYACLVVQVMGTETEGSAGILTAGTGIVYCLNIGSAIPLVGAQVIASFVDNRWVFRYDG